MNFIAKYEFNSDLVYDLRIAVNGMDRFFILKLDKNKKSVFEKDINKESGFVPVNYGEILYTGFDEPDEELKLELNKRFGLYKGDSF